MKNNILDIAIEVRRLVDAMQPMAGTDTEFQIMYHIADEILNDIKPFNEADLRKAMVNMFQVGRMFPDPKVNLAKTDIYDYEESTKGRADILKEVEMFHNKYKVQIEHLKDEYVALWLKNHEPGSFNYVCTHCGKEFTDVKEYLEHKTGFKKIIISL